MSLFSPLCRALFVAIMLSSAACQAPPQPEVLSISGASPPTALLGALASAFNESHLPNRIDIPRSTGVAGAIIKAKASVPGSKP